MVVAATLMLTPATNWVMTSIFGSSVHSNAFCFRNMMSGCCSALKIPEAALFSIATVIVVVVIKVAVVTVIVFAAVVVADIVAKVIGSVFVGGVIVVDVLLILVILVLMLAEPDSTTNVYPDIEC